VAARIWIGIKSRAAHLRRLSVVFAVEIRLKIVTELYMREMSATQFFEEFGGGSPSLIATSRRSPSKAGSGTSEPRRAEGDVERRSTSTGRPTWPTSMPKRGLCFRIRSG
jgi:hypothetical protein